tara:strand:- start:204 stop:392 length:189 start_codon:yes stop_codon:yes gene_type:complete
VPNPSPEREVILSNKTLDQQARNSMASVATLLFKRGYHNAYVQGAYPQNADARTMVGPAYTL